jgi:thioredoxin reductase
MEAAMTAAQRGHEVVLCERAPTLGGQVNLLSHIAHRDEFLGVVRWRRTQLEKLEVDVRLNIDVTRQMVEEIAADVVVIATGSTQRANGWYPPLTGYIPGGDLPHVVTVSDVLTGKIDGARHVVVVDEIGYHQSSDPLEYLVARGATVEGVTSAGAFAADMLLVDRTLWLKSLKGKDVTFHNTVLVREIRPDAVDIEDTYLGRRTTIGSVDAVVLSLGADVNDSLYQSLVESAGNVHLIGDALTPRRIEQAIHEGHKLARAL